MNILCLDLGQDCGWALHYNGQIYSGVWKLKPSKFDSAGVKYLKFKRNIESEILCGDIKKIYYEAVRRHIGTDAAHAYGGYMAVLQAVCLENDIAYEGVPVQTIKKHATGKGNADKKSMIEGAIKKFKTINIINDDHADALWLLDYVLTIGQE